MLTNKNVISLSTVLGKDFVLLCIILWKKSFFWFPKYYTTRIYNPIIRQSCYLPTYIGFSENEPWQI